MTEESFDSRIVVIDNGTASIKAGFAGETTPEAVQPTVIGRTKQVEQQTYFGKMAIERNRGGLLNLQYPIDYKEGGTITDWSDMEKLWEYTFQEVLDINPSESDGVLMTM